MATRNPTWVAQGYRLYSDSGAPGSTALAAENTSAGVLAGGKFRLRVVVGETNNANTANVGSWVLQYSINGGAFSTVTTATAVRSVTSGASGSFSDGTALTQALTAISGSTYQSAWAVADTNASLPSQTWADTFTEYEFCLELNSVSAGQQVTFRMLSPSSSTATTFTNVPTVNAITNPDPLAVTEASVSAGTQAVALAATAIAAFAAVSVAGQSITLTPNDPPTGPDPLVVTAAEVSAAGQGVTQSAEVIASAAAVSFSGQDVTLFEGLTLNFDTVEVSAGGQTVAFTLRSPATGAEASVAGQDITLSTADVTTLDAVATQVSAGTQAVTFLTRTPLTEASVSVVGQAASFALSDPLTAAEVSSAGQAVATYHNHFLPVAAASVSAAGQDVTLTQTGLTSMPVVAAAVDAGGQVVAAFINPAPLAVVAAEVSLAGQSASFAFASPVVGAAVSAAGQDITLTAQTIVSMPVVEAAVSAAGQDITLTPVEPSGVAFRSATQNGLRVAGTVGLTITKPAGVANGDTLVAFIGAGDEAGGAYVCSGWQQASGTNPGAAATTVGNDIGTTVLYKYVSNAAAEPASYTFTNTDTAAQNRVGFVVCVRGPCNSTDPIAELTRATGTNDWTPTQVAITTPEPGCAVLFFHIGNVGTAASKIAGAPATPAGTTLIGTIQQSRSVGNYAAAEAAYYNSTAAETITVGAWTGSADDSASEWHVYSVAVRPAAAPINFPVTAASVSPAAQPVALSTSALVSVPSVPVAGQNITFAFGLPNALDVVPAQVSVQGQDVNALPSEVIAIPASVAVQGQNIVLLSGGDVPPLFVTEAAPTAVGQDIQDTYSVDFDTATVAVAGQTITVSASNIIHFPAEAAAPPLSGQAVALSEARQIAPASVAVQGQSISLARPGDFPALPVTEASVSAAGQDVQDIYSVDFDIPNVSVAGQNVVLTASGILRLPVVAAAVSAAPQAVEIAVEFIAAPASVAAQGQTITFGDIQGLIFPVDAVEVSPEAPETDGILTIDFGIPEVDAEGQDVGMLILPARLPVQAAEPPVAGQNVLLTFGVRVAVQQAQSYVEGQAITFAVRPGVLSVVPATVSAEGQSVSVRIPIIPGKWYPETEPQDSWAEQTEQTDGWTAQNEPSDQWNNTSASSSGWASQSSPSATWTEES